MFVITDEDFARAERDVRSAMQQSGIFRGRYTFSRESEQRRYAEFLRSALPGTGDAILDAAVTMLAQHMGADAIPLTSAIIEFCYRWWYLVLVHAARRNGVEVPMLTPERCDAGLGKFLMPEGTHVQFEAPEPQACVWFRFTEHVRVQLRMLPPEDHQAVTAVIGLATALLFE